MFQSIKNCLNQPDEISQHGKRFELVKRFPYNIGLIGYTNQSSQSVKVVYTRTRKMVFVIKFTQYRREKNMHKHVVGL